MTSSAQAGPALKIPPKNGITAAVNSMRISAPSPSNRKTETMRVAWIQRQFLDYRCAVFEEFDRLCGGNLTVFTLRGFTPDLSLIHI